MVRNLTKDDFRSCAAIAEAVYPDEIENIAKAVEADLTDAFSTANVRPVYLVAEIDGAVIGFIGFMQSMINFGRYQIFWLMVRRDMQRSGIGTQLLSSALEHIKAMQGSYVFLETARDSFFEKHGFEKIDAVEGNFIMRKVI